MLKTEGGFSVETSVHGIYIYRDDELVAFMCDTELLDYVEKEGFRASERRRQMEQRIVAGLRA